MKNILGLDLGTNSIGWSLISLDEGQHDGKIINLGSRILPMSQDILGKFDAGQSISQTAERTGFRGIRRLRERHLLRRERLHRVLNVLGFLPKHYAEQIDFSKRLGQFIPETEPKLPYIIVAGNKKPSFIFQDSFEEMVENFRLFQPQLLEDDRKIPYDWTIYYLRKKALTRKISKEELAWLILHFNQKRGYYQLRGEDEEKKVNKKEEFMPLKVMKVEANNTDKKKDETWYNIFLENGLIYRRTSKTPLEWTGQTKDFIVTTGLNEDGSNKIKKDGKPDISIRIPSDDDWTLKKKRTEYEIERSQKTVGTYIYDSLLQKPDQKIKGKLVRVIERNYYKDELLKILNKQVAFHDELRNNELYKACIEELYPNNLPHQAGLMKRDFVHLFIEDILYYQRPLKSKTSLISNCKFESRMFLKNESKEIAPIKCIAKSHPLFQEFRLWQFIHNLRIYKRESVHLGKVENDVDVNADFLENEDDRVGLFDWLSTLGTIGQKGLLNYFKKKSNTKLAVDEYRWNYVEDKDYPCNETYDLINKRLKKINNVPLDFLNYERFLHLWHILYSVEDRHDLIKALTTFAAKNGLEQTFVEQFGKMKPFDKDYGGYSEKALKKLLPLMRMGKYWNEAGIDSNTKQRIQKILTAEYDEQIKDRVRQKSINLQSISDFKGLPIWLASYIVYDRHSEDGEAKKWATPDKIENLKQHSLRNPIVEQVINETLQVVKDIWKQHGQSKEHFFDEIHIELGREMKLPKAERQKMTNKIIENENTNLRIKALLTELLNDNEIENVRPYSPSQQEILKIYEEGALNGVHEIPDEILKISKLGQPTTAELTKYKLWLQQKYRSPYTGEVIPLSRLFTREYDIEHIIPQSRYFDDSLSNKVICETEVNTNKDNQTAYEYIKNNSGLKLELSQGKTVTLFTVAEYEEFVKANYAKTRGKMKKLLMEDIPESFIERQMNDTRYISKVVKSLMSNIVREEGEQEAISKNVVVCTGGVTSQLKQDWGLNDVWNELITPRFERMNELTKSNLYGEWTQKDGKRVFQTQVPLELSKGFSKKRIDHRHHALDALVIACASRSHINYLNNESAVGKRNNEEKVKRRYDLKNKLCYKKYTDDARDNYKWVFHKPWESFTQNAKEQLLKTVVSFKQNLRVINKTVNRTQQWEEVDGARKKVAKGQKGSTNWAVRKPLHKDTVSGSVTLMLKKTVPLSTAIDQVDMIAEKTLRMKIREVIVKTGDKNKALKYFKELDNKWGDKDISRIEIVYADESNVASRTSINEDFDSGRIENITDTGIQKIMWKHLSRYDELKNGKKVEHPELAFSPEGIYEMNKNIIELNEGRAHKPILKVRKYEPKGNKFNVGNTGNKKHKYVEAAKGTNLFFAIYADADGKRNYDTISLNIVVERQKQGLAPVPETNESGDKLLFYLSPNDLVYVNNNDGIKLTDTNTAFSGNNIYKMVSSSGNQCFFIRHDVSTSIVNKMEFSPLNKMEKSIDGVMIKQQCIKLKVDRLGFIKTIS